MPSDLIVVWLTVAHYMHLAIRSPDLVFVSDHPNTQITMYLPTYLGRNVGIRRLVTLKVCPLFNLPMEAPGGSRARLLETSILKAATEDYTVRAMTLGEVFQDIVLFRAYGYLGTLGYGCKEAQNTN